MLEINQLDSAEERQNGSVDSHIDEIEARAMKVIEGLPEGKIETQIGVVERKIKAWADHILREESKMSGSKKKEALLMELRGDLNVFRRVKDILKQRQSKA